jgi:translation initiation factor 2 gamma subunit (eIF-2gamma)
MKSVIVGTAGHIDHGKTALVKALTGIDADRLKEEKKLGAAGELIRLAGQGIIMKDEEAEAKAQIEQALVRVQNQIHTDQHTAVQGTDRRDPQTRHGAADLSGSGAHNHAFRH